MVGGGNTIGNYAVLHTSTCITNGNKIVGDGLYVSTGAKVTTATRLGNNVTIAANSVVTSNIDSDGLLVVGMPALLNMLPSHGMKEARSCKIVEIKLNN